MDLRAIRHSAGCARMCIESPYVPSCGHSASRREAMVEGSTKVGDPASCQPVNADLEQDMTLAATPDAFAWVVARGRVERQGDIKPHSP